MQSVDRHRTRTDGRTSLAEVAPLARRPHLLDRAEQVVRSVEQLLGAAPPDCRAVADRSAGRAASPAYVPAWGCTRCDTRWVEVWADGGRPTCWCCERDDLVYGV